MTTEIPSDAIAIIGLNGRFPGARNVKEFWRNLRAGVESVSFFKSEELIKQGLDEHLRGNPNYVSADAVLEDIDLFDANFFGFSAREAEILDPQHRLFLEAAWELMELAGYDSESYEGKIAVYAGSALSGYMVRNLYSVPGLIAELGTFKTMLANDKDFLSTRVSYKLNLTGPSININTLCSSSFAAIHLACHSLLDYHCDMALAGGVSIQISRNEAFFYQEGGIGSSDGHCRAFDANANGTTSGSGLGIILLKRLEDAINDGDTIHAVIRGTGLNNDGSNKNSYTAPNFEGQAECIVEALEMAEISPESISYLEAHGTGTNLGDPIEIAGLSRAFGNYTDKKQFCPIGSVKTNIGHLVTAGGVASLIKTVESLKHREIPASLNCDTPNPKIDWENCPFYVNTQLQPWNPPEGEPRRAGISSFGIGGTNVHIILEETPPVESSASERTWFPLLLSAKSEQALKTMSERLSEHLKANPDTNLADAAFTLQVGRRKFPHRRFLVSDSVSNAIKALENQSGTNDQVFNDVVPDREAIFAFSNNVPSTLPQWDFSDADKEFHNHLSDCSARVSNVAGVVIDWNSDSDGDHDKTWKSFALQYALGNLWKEWGAQADCFYGEGIGLFLAGHFSGALSLDGSIALVARSLGITANAKVELSPSASVILSAQSEGIVKAATPEAWLELAGKEIHEENRDKVLQERKMGRVFVDFSLNGAIAKSYQAILKTVDDEPDPIKLGECFGDEGKIMAALGRFWMSGGQVTWKNVYGDEKRIRIELPTYPFDRKRYWIDEWVGDEADFTGSSNTLKRIPDQNKWLYSSTWQEAAGRSAIEGSDLKPSLWVILSDDSDESTALKARFEQNDQEVWFIENGDNFVSLGERHYCVHPDRSEEIRRVLDEISSSGKKRIGVVDFWSASSEVNVSTDDLEGMGALKTLFELSRAMGASDFEKIRWQIVTRGVFSVFGTESSRPSVAMLEGATKAIALEIPVFECCIVDLDDRESDIGVKANFLGQTIQRPFPGPVQALRGKRIWSKSIQPITVLGDSADLLKNNGIYLIAGGLGGLGRSIARHLLEQYQASVVLLDIAINDTGDIGAALGADNSERILAIKADVTKPEELGSAIDEAKTHFGKIDGAFFCVGGYEKAEMLPARTFDSIIASTRTRIMGARNMVRCLENQTIDFLLLFSSVGYALPHTLIGQFGESIVDAYLENLADASEARCPFPVITFHTADWKGIGTAIENERRWKKAKLANPGLLIIEDFNLSEQEGLAVLEQALQSGSRSVAASTYDLELLMEFNRTHSGEMGSDPLESKRSEPKHSRPELSNDYLAPRNDVEKKLAEIWSDFLRVEQVGVNDSFFELGGDSLLAVHLIGKVKDVFAAEITTASLFEGPTVATLARIVASSASDEALKESATRGEKRLEMRRNRRSKLA